MTRFVIRPKSILTTPRALAEKLGARGTRTDRADWSRDFFLSYPENVANADETYRLLRRFASKTKKGQRDAIRQTGVHVPECYESDRCVVRPLRHMAGAGFQIVPRTELQFNPATHYASPFFPKKWEYRLIFVKGRHTLTLFKRVDPGTPSDVPWNHACGSTFVTTDNWENCRLRHTEVLTHLLACPIIQAAHLVAVDVMLNKTPGGSWNYAVCEYNFCPSLSIEGNLEKVIENAG